MQPNTRKYFPFPKIFTPGKYFTLKQTQPYIPNIDTIALILQFLQWISKNVHLKVSTKNFILKKNDSILKKNLFHFLLLSH